MKALLTLLLAFCLSSLTGQKVLNQISYAPGYLAQSTLTSHNFNYERTYQISPRWHVGGELGYTQGERSTILRHPDYGMDGWLFCGVGMEYVENQLKMARIGHVVKYEAWSSAKYGVLLKGGIGFGFTNISEASINRTEHIKPYFPSSFQNDFGSSDYQIYSVSSRILHKRWTVPSLGMEFVRKFDRLHLTLSPTFELYGERRTNSSLRLGIQW